MLSILKSGENIFNADTTIKDSGEVSVTLSEHPLSVGFENEDKLINEKSFTILEEFIQSNEDKFRIFRSENKFYVKSSADTFIFESLEQEDLFDLVKGGSTNAGGIVYPPMPGSVVEVLVKDGQRVQKGDVVMIIEAMKMETTLTADIEGIVSALSLKKGDRFDTDTILFSVDKEKSDMR